MSERKQEIIFMVVGSLLSIPVTLFGMLYLIKGILWMTNMHI